MPDNFTSQNDSSKISMNVSCDKGGAIGIAETINCTITGRLSEGEPTAAAQKNRPTGLA